MTDRVEYIDLTPTFEQYAGVLITLLEAGDSEGRKMARAELIRWGKMLDALKAEQEARKKGL